MRVSVFGEISELPVTTVTLVRDEFNPTNLSMMYCMKCANGLIQYQGHIVRVIPGGLPQNILELSSNLIIKCSKCKTRYLIHNII